MLLEGFEQIQLGLHNPISVSNVKDPVNNNDAANKKYVDDAVANVKPSGDYLPLSGGSMSGPIQFDTTATVASIPDMGFGIQVPNGYTGIVSQGIMHTDKAVSLDSNAVTYDIVNTQIAPGTTIKNYVCTGSGFQQMSFNGFSNVKMNSQLLLAEDPTQKMQAATKQYVDNKAGGGILYTQTNSLLHVVTPINDSLAKLESYFGGSIYISASEERNNYWFGTYDISDDVSAALSSLGYNPPTNETTFTFGGDASTSFANIFMTTYNGSTRKYTIKVIISITMTAGTKYPEILSAIFAIGAFVLLASTTNFTISETVDSFPILSALYFMNPS